jgi:hypothetical protein
VHAAAHTADVHPSTAEMPASAEAATTMPSAAETTTTMATAAASTSGENGRSDRQCRSHGRRDDAGEKPVVHLKILLVTATVSPLQRTR